MNANPFSDDNSAIPLFGRNGTALSQEERAAIARKRGLCLKCFVTKTHNVKLMGRTALTNDDVYQGHCIKCNPQSVPSQVLAEWQSRNAPSHPTGLARWRGVAHANRLVHHRPGGAGPITPAPAPVPQPRRTTAQTNVITAEVTPAVLTTSSTSRPRSTQHLHTSNRSVSPPADNEFSASMRSNGSNHIIKHQGSSRGSDISGGPQHEDYKSADDRDAFAWVKVLKDNRDRPDVLREALHGLRNLADDKQSRAMYEIKHILDTYKSDTRLMIVAFGAVWAISSKSDTKKQEATDTGCLDIIIDSIRSGKLKDDPELVHWALGSIASLAELPTNKKFIGDRGGIEIIIQSINQHQSNSSVFEWGCRALYALVSSYGEGSNGTSFDRDIAAIEDSHGIRCIVASMNHHVTEAGVQMWALKLLFRLFDRVDPASNDKTFRLMNEADLRSTCMRMIRARSTNVNLFVQAGEMLRLLLLTSSTSVQHSAADCIHTISRFVMENPSNEELLEMAAGLFTVIVRDNHQAKRHVSEGNMLRTFISGMKSSPENAGLHRAMAGLFWTLSSDESVFDYSLLKELIDMRKTALQNSKGALEDRDEFLMMAFCGIVGNHVAALELDLEMIPMEMILKLASMGGNVSKEAGKTLQLICSKQHEAADMLVENGVCDRQLEGLCSMEVDVQLSSSSSLTMLAGISDVARNKIIGSGGLETVSAALYATASEPLAQSLLQLLSSLVTSTSKKLLQVPNETIQAVLHIMRTFPGTQKDACMTICNIMLVSVPGFSSVNSDGLCDILCGIINSPSNPDALVIEACRATWAYSGKQNTSANEKSQFFTSLLGLCSRHKGDGSPFNASILAEASGALACVVHSIQENPIHIPENDIDLVISVLDVVIEYDVENVSLMSSLMDVIMTLCYIAKEVLIQFGVIVVIIDCMVEHEKDESIQQKGCTILALLASTENLQVNLSIAETDGIDMIVSALMEFPENLSLQTDACRALSHLSIDHESRMLITSQGGLILLVNAMLKFKDDVDLLEAACSALLNLSSDAEEPVLAASNVVDTVVKTMLNQTSNSALQEKALGILQNISMRSRDAKKSIAEANGIGAIAFAIKEFMGSPTVLERAFTTMWSMAVLEENQILIANEGGIGLVINGMMANITYEKVQKQACGCLCTLSSDSRNKSLIRDLGGVDAIVYAMWAHYNSDGLLTEACRALSSLAVNVQTNEVMIASEGEISSILSAMKRFPQSERLQEHACVALRNFLLSSDNAAIVRSQSHEIEQLMNMASAMFPDRCAERARQVIASIR